MVGENNQASGDDSGNFVLGDNNQSSGDLGNLVSVTTTRPIGHNVGNIVVGDNNQSSGEDGIGGRNSLR